MAPPRLKWPGQYYPGHFLPWDLLPYNNFHKGIIIFQMELGRANPWRMRAYYAGAAAGALYRNRRVLYRAAQQAAGVARSGRQMFNRARQGAARSSRVNAARTPQRGVSLYGGATTYRRAKTYFRRNRRRGMRKRMKYIRNKGYRHTTVRANTSRGGYRAFTLSNRALTNILCPMNHEHVEESLTHIVGVPNEQSASHYYIQSCQEVKDMYQKSLDGQNIVTQSNYASSTDRNLWLKVCKFVSRFRFQNAANTTVTIKFIEARYRKFSDYEITDRWTEDLQVAFPIVDAQTTPNGEAMSIADIGCMPFGKYHRRTNKEFKLLKKSVVTLEPGQTCNYDVVCKGRAINVSDVNDELQESGGKPQYGPFTKVLLVIINGQLVQDQADGSTGYGTYQVEVVRSIEKFYRCQLQQQTYNYYKNADRNYASFTGTQQHVNPTGEHINTYAES